jgi:inositol-1,3,4-trisphosphate 5/6-kinase/inositol-tetrakisphosphate 1-kinase
MAANQNSSPDRQSMEEELTTTDTDSFHSSIGGSSFASSRWQEPIVVGYAFGPKKMSTMGVVMAEASRVKVIHEAPEVEDLEEEEEEEEEEDSTHESSVSKMHKIVPSALTSDALQGLELQEYTKQSSLYKKASSPLGSTVITLGNPNNESSELRHIVRYFRSNCSSAAGSLASISETSGSTTAISLNNNGSTCSSRRRKPTNRFPILISFVPLDPDQPLEDQHGGSFDLILHKLTEDILSCSLHDYNYNAEFRHEEDPSWKRVQALLDYYNRNSHCCLVDNPRNVQTVMSRSDIANVLQRCLKNVKTTSGVPVRSPKFVVVPGSKDPEQRVQDLKTALQEKGLGVVNPLIVKPLIAAGTKQSHFMLIALKESAFNKIPPKSIVQEFINHGSTLFKVYVLGDFVSVYKRHSLPDLPEDLSNATVDLVQFDSQRPYPKLEDFGLDAGPGTINTGTSTQTTPVTVEEVMPIVNALKKAFGLELFGFDILRRSSETETEWLVCDVNYFPSYKEVPNFPSLLARYLTMRVLEQRRTRDRATEITSNGIDKECMG